MSEYRSQTTTFKDRECLIEALVTMGYAREHIEVHETAQRLYGYHGDLREQKANVIVRRQHVGSAANDIGWEKLSDGTYKQHISDFDSGKHNAKWLAGLKTNYSEKNLIKTAKKQGFKYLGKKVVAGKVQIQWLDTRQ